MAKNGNILNIHFLEIQSKIRQFRSRAAEFKIKLRGWSPIYETRAYGSMGEAKIFIFPLPYSFDADLSVICQLFHCISHISHFHFSCTMFLP